MNSVNVDSSESRGLDFERRAAAIERFLERNVLWVLVLLSILYFVGTAQRARGKPFWFDEIATLLAAQQSNLHDVVGSARLTEFGPPGATLVGYFVNKTVGSGEVAFRIPAMVGFWVFCLCLFAFAARRVSAFFALSAMLLPFATGGEVYSFEARGYPLVLGCCGVALYCWQSVTLGRRRWLSLFGIALSIGAAIFFNYYAVFILLPLAGGEIVRSIHRREIDWPIWAAFLLGAMALSSILFYRQGLDIARPFSVAHRQDYLTFYSNVLDKSLWFFVPLAVLISAWLMLNRDCRQQLRKQVPAIPVAEICAATLLLLLPLAAITVALAVPPHTFIDRYALSAIGGFALVSSFIGAYFAGGRSALGLGFATAAFLPFAFALTQGRPPENPFDQRPILKQAATQGPVVLTDFVTLMQARYYAPQSIRPDLIGLSDEALYAKYVHISQHVEGFRSYGVPMISYDELVSTSKPFRAYLTPGYGWWLPQKILDDGGHFDVLAWGDGEALIMVHPK